MRLYVRQFRGNTVFFATQTSLSQCLFPDPRSFALWPLLLRRFGLPTMNL